eukprot:414500-Alexandrium_andersonii.AAC.1
MRSGAVHLCLLSLTCPVLCPPPFLQTLSRRPARSPSMSAARVGVSQPDVGVGAFSPGARDGRAQRQSRPGQATAAASP